MVIARKKLVRTDAPECYHLVSRCVRRMQCLADDERRAWVENCLRIHASKMAIDVLTYAIMRNHLHVVMRIRPDLAERWSAREVVDRWLDLVPQRDASGRQIIEVDEWMRELLSTDSKWVRERRSRLCSMSWLMRLVKQKIAIRMNRDDDVTGHFWDERFLSIALLDQRAIMACMVYVDLNPFRARECTVPEQGLYIGLQVRLENMEYYEQFSGEEQRIEMLGAEGIDFLSDGKEHRRSWLVPLVGCGTFALHFETGWMYDEPCVLTEKRYLELLDSVAREVRYTKSGKEKNLLAGGVEGILERMGL